jgi:UDP-N-acetylmuramoylalanine--D-glutamate ligase
MVAENLINKKVVVLGAARSGLAACRLAHELGAEVTIIDDFKSELEISRELNLPQIKIKQTDYDPHTLETELLIPSPGIPASHPLISLLLKRGIPVLSEVEVASRFTEAPIIAVTGSNGKSTVTSMLHDMLHEAGFHSFLGGNIGISFAANVLEEKLLKPTAPIQVVEISSFQAEYLDQFRPAVAVFLNLAPDHMDRYPNLAAYGQAKVQMARNITNDGWIIYNLDDPFFRSEFEDREGAIPFADHLAEKALFQRTDNWILHQNQQLIEIGDLSLPGPHNVLNFLAAATAAKVMGVELSVISKVMREFKGLPHRLELVAEVGKVRYYNDSKATNVAATKVALASFSGNIILIMGGSDKGVTDYSELVNLIRERVKLLITYGEAGNRLSQLFKGLVPLHYERVFDSAVNFSRQNSRAGDIVLLAPACASFDQFSNFEERGESFRRIIQSMSEESILA